MRNQSLKIVAFLLVLMLMPMGAWPAGDEGRLTVLAEGSGATKLEALQQAWMEAVRKGVGLFLTSKTQAVDDDVTEKIVTHSRGQVDSYKVLSEVQENGIWTVGIEASIDKDILKETAAQGKTRKMAFDGTAVAAREDTQEKKRQSQGEILTDALNDLNLASILRYKTELKKKALPDGKAAFYVEHILSVDPQQFAILADQLERTLAPIADGKLVLKMEDFWGQTLQALQKDWTNVPEKTALNRFIVNPNDNRRKLSTTPRVVYLEKNKNCVCFYKNAAKAVCYTFENVPMKEIISQLKRTYAIRFEVEGGSSFSEMSDAFSVEWPYASSYIVFIDPTFYSYGDNIATLVYNQQLKLDREQLVELKEISAEYTITKK